MDIYTTRHPVFDQHREIIGYELLMRRGRLLGMGAPESEQEAMRMLDFALHGFGFDLLVGAYPAVLRVSAEFMVRGHWAALPERRVHLKLQARTAPTDALVAACAAAAAAGHRLILADAAHVPELERLLPVVESLAVDFAGTDVEERVAFARRHASSGRPLLAEKVSSYDQFREAAAAGYTRFQGYFFCEAEGFSARDITASSTTMALMLVEVNRPELDLDALEALIRQDLALSVRLLRYLQSAGMGWRHEVSTLGQGLRILGHRAARTWASLTAYTLMCSDKPKELATTSLVRAHLCEELGTLVLGEGKRSELFLVGLLSTLDAVFDRPMSVILAEMPLAGEVTATLLGEASPLADALALTIAYDQGEWDRVDDLTSRLGLAPEALPEAYHRTVTWVGGIAAA